MPYQPTWNSQFGQAQTYGQGQQLGQAQQMGQSQQFGQSQQYGQQQYGQSQLFSPMQQYQQFNGIVPVNGPDSAMQFALPPNSISYPLIDRSFDGKNGVMYIVSTDGTGTKSVESFSISKIDEADEVGDGERGVSRDEFDSLKKRVDQMEAMRNGSDGTAKPAARTSSKPASKPAARTSKQS